MVFANLNVTISSLSLLTPVGTNQYQLVTKFYNSSGSAPLNNANIPNVYTAVVTTVSTTFVIKVPIVDGTWSATTFIKVFANTDTNCCYAQGVFTISNTQSTIVNNLETSFYYSI